MFSKQPNTGFHQTQNQTLRTNQDNKNKTSEQSKVLNCGLVVILNIAKIHFSNVLQKKISVGPFSKTSKKQVYKKVSTRFSKKTQE